MSVALGSVDGSTSGSASGSGIGTDTLFAFDNVIGSSGGDTLTGNAGANTLDGRAGDDTLTGGAGDDTLLGGQGTDTLIGGQGVDQLTGGVGADVFGFQGGTGTQGTFARAQSLGTDSILDFEAALDSFLLSNTDFGLGSTGTLSETANSLSYVETGTTITGTAADTNGGGDSSTGAAFVVVGGQSGGAGFEVWFTTNQEAADTANSYQGRRRQHRRRGLGRLGRLQPDKLTRGAPARIHEDRAAAGDDAAVG